MRRTERIDAIIAGIWCKLSDSGVVSAQLAFSERATTARDLLTFNMNRIRQAAITKEIIEVVSGAAAA